MRTAMLVCLLAIAGAASAEEPLKIPNPVPLVPGSDVSDEMLQSCDIRRYFGEWLQRELSKSNPQPVSGRLDTSKGRVLDVEIVDAMWAGNWFIGHQQWIKVRGTLYEDGKKVASFKGERNGRGDLTTGCFNLRSLFGAMSHDIRKWLKKPQDGAKIGAVY